MIQLGEENICVDTWSISDLILTAETDDHVLLSLDDDLSIKRCLALECLWQIIGVLICCQNTVFPNINHALKITITLIRSQCQNHQIQQLDSNYNPHYVCLLDGLSAGLH